MTGQRGALIDPRSRARKRCETTGGGPEASGGQDGSERRGSPPNLMPSPICEWRARTLSSPPNSATPVLIPGFAADFVGFRETSWDEEIHVSARQQRNFGSLWDVVLPSKVGRPLRQFFDKPL